MECLRDLDLLYIDIHVQFINACQLCWKVLKRNIMIVCNIQTTYKIYDAKKLKSHEAILLERDFVI